MPVDRPTFSESWYRVAALRPRLLASIQVHRQHFRGQTWYVVQDPANNQFFRLNQAAWRFIGLLDGRRTVAEAWEICNDQLGDEAPTQGEAIQLLGQLYTSNLLSAELPPDAESLFRRYRQRIRREVQSYLMNLLFIRIPLLDPERFLDRWIGVFGRLFTWYGGLVWLVLILTGVYFVLGDFARLRSQTTAIFSQMQILNNLPLLYVAMVFVKVAHEFGHAFACKRFGQQTGTGGEVHVMGVMFLVFTPLPYVDASSSWAFRSKWQRVVVGLAGMIVELAIAAVAAIIWARTSPGSLLNNLCYNVVFIAGVSTLLFNANPLLRYDGYYILSDLLEMPNLWQRSRQYLYYLVKHYVWGVRRPHNPANTRGERVWLLGYSLASTIYRVFICVAILLFIADRLFLLGAVLAAAAVIAWVFVPLGQFLHYLATSGELMRVRARAVLTTAAVLLAVLTGIGLTPAADRCRAEAVVEPIQLAVIHAAADGFVTEYLPSGARVGPDGPALLRLANPDLDQQHDELLAMLDRLQAERRLARDVGDAAAVKALDEHLAALGQQQRWLGEQMDRLTVRSPIAGQWIAPNIHRVRGAYLQQGDAIGLVADPDRLVIRAVTGQDDARLIEEARPVVEIRVLGRPDLKLAGRIEKIVPAGQERLPSAALGYAAGGSIPVALEDRQGTKAAERFFEIRIAPEPDSVVPLLSGQRVVVRFSTPAKPLARQWWRAILQLVQRRFHA